ncbi:cytidine deaminase-like protein [Hypoxylon sp. FL0890]|nr:cytidine deaminase-like protein [Hypoxylon sp. FL0890]
MSDSMKEVVETLDPVTRRLLPSTIHAGTLVPLKTTLELRDNLTLGLAYITRAPNKVTNDVVTIARALAGDDAAKNLPHLRRCVKPSDLPSHLKSQFIHAGNGRQVHASKSNFLYIILGREEEVQYEELVRNLFTIDALKDDNFVALIPVPLLAPTSQVQANMWSQQYWQSVYRKNNPLGPHPATVTRTESSVARDASVWLNLAHQIAKKAQEAGIGEPIGAVIVKRTYPGRSDGGRVAFVRQTTMESDLSPSESNIRTGPRTGRVVIPGQNTEPNRSAGLNHDADYDGIAGPGCDAERRLKGKDNEDEKETTQIVAIAGDARWHQQEKTGHTGNPMAHAALRAISMVAQKLVRAENRSELEQKIMDFESFQDNILLDDERVVFEADHPVPDGYLCHELELYMTHEPCVMCAMAILHSRMGRTVFRHRMPLTGGMSAEDRDHEACKASATCSQGQCGGGQGLGLHWRKELNWTLLGWEWESDELEHLPIDAHFHA